MIAKQIKGKDFYGLLMYHQKKVESGDAYVLDSNIDLAKVISMTKEFNIVRQLRPRLQKAVYHVSLNLPTTDRLSDNEFSSLAEDYLQGMGFDDNQNLVYMHIDQDHQHIHIIANRVKFSGDVVSDSGDYKRSQKLVRKLEKKYRLTQLSENIKGEKATLTQKEIEKALRIGEVPIKLILQKHVNESLEQAKNMGQFLYNLKSRKIEPKFNLSKSTERVMGISFKHKDVTYKGSTLGRKFSWNNIIKQIDYEQNRDRAIIFKANRAEQRIERFSYEASQNAKHDVRKSKKYGAQPENNLQKVERQIVKGIGTQNTFFKSNKPNSYNVDKKSRLIRKSSSPKVLDSFLTKPGSSHTSTNSSINYDQNTIADIDLKKRKKKRPKLF